VPPRTSGPQRLPAVTFAVSVGVLRPGSLHKATLRRRGRYCTGSSQTFPERPRLRTPQDPVDGTSYPQRARYIGATRIIYDGDLPLHGRESPDNGATVRIPRLDHPAATTHPRPAGSTPGPGVTAAWDADTNPDLLAYLSSDAAPSQVLFRGVTERMHTRGHTRSQKAVTEQVPSRQDYKDSENTMRSRLYMLGEAGSLRKRWIRTQCRR
jgi:hypothetical protein